MHSDISDDTKVDGPVWRPLTDTIGRWGTKHRRWLFVATILGAFVAVVSQWIWTDIAPVVGDKWAEVLRWGSILLGVTAAAAAVADKITDRWEERRDEKTLAQGELAAERAVLALNVVLDEAIRTLFLSGRSRVNAVETLRRTAVQQAALGMGMGTRATAYTFDRDRDGYRVLADAVHGTVGRKDKSNRPFRERDSPTLDIWTMLERVDDEPQVRREPEPVTELDWSSREYKEFLSVAVKARDLPLGMLSVNHTDIGAIGGSQRAVIIALARTVALATAASCTTKELVEREIDEKNRIGQNTKLDASVSSIKKGAE